VNIKLIAEAARRASSSIFQI